MPLRIFFFTFLLFIHKVSAEIVPVKGVVGDTVVLPCLIENNPQHVFWRFKDSIVVCDITGSPPDIFNQPIPYKDRVKIFPSEIKKGNFSISLSHVTKNDEGLYTCTAPNVKTANLKLTITEVKISTRKLTPPDSGSQNGQPQRQAEGLLSLLLVSTLLYSFNF